MLVGSFLLLSWLTGQVMGAVDPAFSCEKDRCSALNCKCWKKGTCSGRSSSTPAPTEAPTEAPTHAVTECPIGTRSDPQVTPHIGAFTCPAGTYMCEGQMLSGSGYLEHYMASPDEISAINKKELALLVCKVKGLAENPSGGTGPQPIVMKFEVNDAVAVHEGITDEDVCLHLQLMQKNPVSTVGVLMQTVGFINSHANQGNVYTFTGQDPNIHYGTTMSAFCSPGPLTHITMCVTPCESEGMEEIPTDPPVPATDFPTLAAGAATEPPIENEPCPDHGRGGLGANFTYSETLGDGGAKTNSCPKGNECTIKDYSQEFLQFNDIAQGHDDGYWEVFTCKTTDQAGNTHYVDVKTTMIDEANYMFSVETQGYLIVGGIIKSGASGNTVFSWPICGANAACCTGLDCQYCGEDDADHSYLWGGDADAYGGKTEVVMGTPIARKDFKTKASVFSQQAMSHVNLCIAPTSEVCPGADCM